MKKKTALISTASGMLAILAGRKIAGMTLFAKGIFELEKHWQKDNDFNGSMKERWQRAIDFYNDTHRNPTNRWLHITGIPLILGGTIGLLTFPSYRPMWVASAGLFAGGWALNLIGHGVFEKNKPALADDPLAFVAGPVWEIQQLTGKGEESPVEDAVGKIEDDGYLPSMN